MIQTKPTVQTVQYDTLLMSMICLYIGSLILANLLNVSRIITFDVPLLPFHFTIMAPIGLICYPVTFFCTDVICELYGKLIAKKLIWIGFWVNLGACGILILGNKLPYMPGPHIDTFATLSMLTLGCTISSSVAYLVTQNLDVYVFHKLKDLCNGKHLWLRNNASTLISQLVDTFIVVLMVKMLTGAYPTLPDESTSGTLLHIMISMYSFKFLIALLDTLPLYLIVNWHKNRALKLELATSL